jgi:hypothetical protein
MEQAIGQSPVEPGRMIRQQGEYLWDCNFPNYRATGTFCIE